MFQNIYQGKNILVTGHTGFKGSWLVQWLDMLGANVAGLALRNTDDISHHDLLKLDIKEYFIDIRDRAAVQSAFDEFQPDFVFHLAAQSLVIPSYDDPIETWSTNMMGTTHILESIRNTPSVKGSVIITTDKCYANKENPDGYCESDELGGHDPYSASKACCELIVASYRSSFWTNDPNAPLVASARAGNVIGGGDWSDYRIIPDIVRALQTNQDMILRNPQSVRPWQHVLESLSGYLLLGQQLMSGKTEYARAYNFGPQANDVVPVIDIVKKFKDACPHLNYVADDENLNKPHETNYLRLDSSLATKDLNWHPVWNTHEGIDQTIAWYQAFLNNNVVETKNQIEAYCQTAKTKHCVWAIES